MKLELKADLDTRQLFCVKGLFYNITSKNWEKIKKLAVLITTINFGHITTNKLQ